MSGFRSDHLLVRDYITAMDHLQYAALPEGIVCILMTHSNIVKVDHPDIRLDLHMRISEVKEKFRLHIGTPVDFQRLILKDSGRVVCEMGDDNKMLGFYSVISGMEIHIIDTDPYSLSRNGGLQDVSLVEKYKMTEEDYSKRKGTMRSYIQEQRAKDPKFKLRPKGAPPVPEPSNEPPPDAATCAHVTIGSRCQCAPGARRGVVAFIGEFPDSKRGHWVGVRFDEPVGTCDGTAKGVTLFECEPMYGGFIRGKNVKCGEYPVRDIMDESDGEEEEENAGAKDAESDEDEM